MQKLDMLTPDIIQANIEALAKLFPNIITETENAEGTITKAIDYDLFRQMFSSSLVEGGEERYRLDWPGKRASILKANTPISKTLRPVVDDSVNWDTTENLYIEGDNFEVLKVLQESYLGKVKMIYIDPPYNTGKDFIYTDKFKVSREEYEEGLEIVDEEGGKLVKNTDTNGRFHSDWLSMMYERLVVARDLLRDDGIIFISINDYEVENLKKVCSEVFGEENTMESFVWIKKTPPNNVIIGSVHEYILAFSKQIDTVKLFLRPRTEEDNKNYNNPDNDPRGPWMADNITSPAKGGRSTPTLVYELENPFTGEKHLPPSGRMWSVPKNVMLDKIKEGTIVWGKDNNGRPMNKRFLNETRDGVTMTTLIDNGGSNNSASKEIQKLFDGIAVFETPKPTLLIKKLLYISTSNDDLVIDFFSGSCATAESIFQINAEDGGNRKFIMVQIPEETDKESEAYKAGYANICEIGKERIRRAGNKIVEENKDKEGIENLDIGFRVYRLDTSNMKDVYYHPTEVSQDRLFEMESNIKEDRTPEDILAQVMLDLGLTLDLPIEKRAIHGSTVYYVAENSLVACFDEHVDFSLVDEIASVKPLRVVFRDSSFSTDADRINFETRFAKLSPETDIRVI